MTGAEDPPTPSLWLLAIISVLVGVLAHDFLMRCGVPSYQATVVTGAIMGGVVYGGVWLYQWLKGPSL